jgi:hypothetical protein
VTVVDQAENVGGVVSAARLRESFMRRRANASNEEEREALGDAIGTLEVRFPELEDLPAGGADRFARSRGHGKSSRSPSHEGRQRRRSPDAAPLEEAARKAGAGAKPKPKPTSNARPPATPSSSARKRASTNSHPRAKQAYRETGIPAAGASASRIVMSALGGTIGIVAVYLLLVSAEGKGPASKALPAALGAAAGFLQRVIAPVDFFGPGLSPAQAVAAENPHSIAATELNSLAAAPTLTKPLRPGLKIRPRQLGMKRR